MANEVEKLNYIYAWFVSEEGFGIVDDVYFPSEAEAFTRINSYDFKAAKKREVRAEARRRIEEALPIDQQLGVMAEAMRVLLRQQPGFLPTAAQLAKIAAFTDSEDSDVAPIRARAKQLTTQINAQSNWQTIADFDVVANW